MAVIDDIKEMKAQGTGEDEITKRLKDQGVTPREIDDSMSESRIKAAVAQDDFGDEYSTQGMQPSLRAGKQPGTPQSPIPQQMAQEAPAQGGMPALPQQDMPRQPMPGPQPLPAQGMPGPEQVPQQSAPQMPMPMQGPQAQEMPQMQPQQMPPEYQDYAQAAGYEEGQEQGFEEQGQYQDYGYGPEYDQGALMNTEMMNDIAEQIVAERFDKISKRISELSGFKARAEAMINNIDTRLQKVESSIDQLQISIMKKISDYVSDIGDIKSEMHGMQSSFGKIMDPLADNIRDLQKITKPKKTPTKKRKPAKKKTTKKKK